MVKPPGRKPNQKKKRKREKWVKEKEMKGTNSKPNGKTQLAGG